MSSHSSKEYNREWALKNRDKRNASARKYYAKDKNPDRYKERNRRYRRDALECYGGVCKCCGEDRYEFLTFDHINNDGAEHRRDGNVGSGTRFVTWLRRNDYPDIVQVLCMNCNHAKGHYGSCPHTRETNSFEQTLGGSTL